MPLQMRTYTINRGALHDFAQEWAQTIKPLREKIGFDIPAAWTVAETNQFICLMHHSSPETWDSLDQAFHQHPERRAMKPNPARHIARMENQFIETVPL